MAREVRLFQVTVPAGTPKAAAQVTNLGFPPRVVREIQIRVPPGPRGSLGFQLAQAGNQVFPTEPGAFFVTDDERLIWPVEGANTSGAWQLIAFNTGIFDHTLEVRFLVDLSSLQGAAGAGPVALQPLPESSLDLGPQPDLVPAPPPAVPIPPLPASAPPGVPLAPGPAGLPGPQAPALPGLPPPPPLPPLPPAAIDAATRSVLDQIEAAGQAALQGSIQAANAAALLDWLEALGQAAHEGALGNAPAPPPASGGGQVFI